MDHDDQVILNGLEFACSAGVAGVTTTIFPDGSIGDQFPVVFHQLIPLKHKEINSTHICW